MRYRTPINATIPASEIHPPPPTDTDDKIVDKDVIDTVRTWHGGLYRVNMIARDEREEPFIIATLIGYAN
jgi:predicted  nucleic acid-binding Zn-ribbon protein